MKYLVTYILFFCCCFCVSLNAQNIWVDMATYSVLKPYQSTRSGQAVSPWLRLTHDCAEVEEVPVTLRSVFPHRARRAQGALEDLSMGGVRITTQVLTSLEGGLLESPLVQSHFGLLWLRCISGWKLTSKSILAGQHYYLKDLQSQLEYLKHTAEQPQHIYGQMLQLQLPKGKDALRKKSQNAAHICSVLALQGGHLLGQYHYTQNGRLQHSSFRKEVLKNISILKGLHALEEGTNSFWTHPIFYISFNNLYEDGIVGKASQITKTQQHAFGQLASNEGFTEIGEDAVQALLDAKNGYRILIDVCGMSLQGRREYYAFVQKKLSQKDTIPVLANNVGISGLDWNLPEYGPAADTSPYPNTTRALSKQDIISIYQSKGLIGLSWQLNALATPKYAQTFYMLETIEARQRFLHLFLGHLFRIVDTVRDRSAWSFIALGSGLDTPFAWEHPYGGAENWSIFMQDVKDFLSDPQAIPGFSKEKIQRLMFDYSASEIVTMIGRSNAQQFLQKHMPTMPSQSLATQEID